MLAVFEFSPLNRKPKPRVYACEHNRLKLVTSPREYELAIEEREECKRVLGSRQKPSPRLFGLFSDDHTHKYTNEGVVYSMEEFVRLTDGCEVVWVDMFVSKEWSLRLDKVWKLIRNTEPPADLTR